MAVDDEPLSLRSLDKRVDAIERRDIEADIVHKRLEVNDGETAQAVRDLTVALNHPRTGLIVELDKFRADVKREVDDFRAEIRDANDKRNAWYRGAAFVLSGLFVVWEVVSPWIRGIIETLLNVRPPTS